MNRIGIDWGTHSSKWFAIDEGKPIIGQILSSTLCSDHDSRTLLFPEVGRIPAAGPTLKLVERLKRKIIEDTGAVFFGVEPRPDLGVSLGVAVVFSLASLLKSSKQGIAAGKVCIAFSYPNWLGADDRPAVENFRAAALTAVRIMANSPQSIPMPGKPISWSDIGALVQKYKVNPAPSQSVGVSRETVDGIEVRFVIESVAAALPVLNLLEQKNESYRRLLVVDVGAGSTDIGYVCIYRDTENEDFHFVFFAPHPAFGNAGEVLTKKYLSVKRSGSMQEAELSKISDSEAGRLRLVLGPVLESWNNEIARNAEQYCAGIELHSMQKATVPVDLVLTGGSSAVQDLSEAVRAHSSDGLLRRIPGMAGLPNSYAVKEYGELIPGFQDKVQQRRFAISHGLCLPAKNLIAYAEFKDDAFKRPVDAQLGTVVTDATIRCARCSERITVPQHLHDPDCRGGYLGNSD